MQNKLPDMGPSIFSKMSGMAIEYNALNLSQGFPDFPTDPRLIELVTKAMHDGYNQYAPLGGIYSLREKIAEMIHSLHGRQYDPGSEITLTVGASEALFNAITAFV
ncbi:MAG: aminotransferase class I/II-fold pyridoxal phosphate-dependent enzyme, partial [Leeuwenhoekiella sp.]